MIKYDREIPHNNLPLIPPSDSIITTEVLKAVNNANKQLYLLKGIAKRLPNQSMLVNTMVLRESKASTQIENIFTTEEELYKAISGDDMSLSGNAKEVLRYRQALWLGYNEIQTTKFFSIELFIKLYQTIKQESDGIRSSFFDSTVIRKRSSSGFDNVINLITGNNIIYTPPRGEKVITDKLENIVDYLNDDTKYQYDPLIKLAISHYQFEAIHPFRDGNGRTGRIINTLILAQKNLLDIPILYLSAYIINTKTEYYNLLNAVTTRGKWEEWIIYMMNAIEETSKYTIHKINQIEELINRTTQLVKKRSKIKEAFVLQIFEQPYIFPKDMLTEGAKSLNTVKKNLKILEDLKILLPVKIGSKNVYLNEGLLNILKET